MMFLWIYTQIFIHKYCCAAGLLDVFLLPQFITETEYVGRGASCVDILCLLQMTFDFILKYLYKYFSNQDKFLLTTFSASG